MRDRMTLCRVEQPDTSYVLPKTAGTRATNWFEGMDLPEVEPFELDENCYSSRDKVGVLLKNPRLMQSCPSTLAGCWMIPVVP